MLTFDDAKHEYRWNGIVKPSVTQIIEGCGLRPPYPANSPNKTLGVAVHRAVELWHRQELDESRTHSRILPFLEQYRRFYTEIGKPTLLCGEKQFYSAQYDYCGTIDLTFDLGDCLLIVDMKRTDYTPPKESTRLQTGGYSVLVAPDEIHRTKRYSLALREDSYKAIPYTDNENDIKDFLACNRVYRIKNKNGRG
jgi:hypothetical protein